MIHFHVIEFALSILDLILKKGIVLSGSSAPPPTAALEPPPATVLQTPGSNARSSKEWRPSKLLCKRFNVPDPFFGRAETSQTAQSSSNRMSKTLDTAALLGISGSHSASAVVDMAALERLAAALKQTADEDKSKQALSLSQAEGDAPKAVPSDKVSVVPDISSADTSEPLPRAPDDLFASIFGLDEEISEDVELPPAVTATSTTSTVEPAVAPISNDELANMYSAMSKGGGPSTSSMARPRKFSSAWDEAPSSSAGGFSASSARLSESLAAPVPNHGTAIDALSSASHFLKTISSDAYDGFLPSMDELQRDNGASFKQLKSRDSVNQSEQLPSWRSKLVPASDQTTDAAKSIKDKVDIKMQALAAAREALVSSSNAPASSQRPENNVCDVMYGPSLPPPGSAWAGPSWQPKPVSWGSAPAVRGSQSFVAASSAVAQPSNQNIVQPVDCRGNAHPSTTSPRRETHSHSSKHKHRDSKSSKDHEADSKHRHRSDSSKQFKDEVKEGHKHRHRGSDDGGDRRHHRR